MSSVYVQPSLWAGRSGCTHSFYQAFLFLELCDVTENGGAARTERSPMYRSIFLIAGIFFFSKFMLKNISVVNILSSAAESTPKQRVSIIPTNQSVRNKHRPQTRTRPTWRPKTEMKVYFQSCKTKFPGLGKSSPSQEFLKDRTEAQCELKDYFELHIMQSC